MRHVPIAAFKDKVSEYVAAAEAGDEIVITRHGKIAARLLPAIDRAASEARARLALDTLARIRAEARAKGMTATMDEMIGWKNEGRR